MNLVLGTAQLGLHYGISNKFGQVTEETTKKILSRAKEVGIDTLDTAISYGLSEQCLGKVGVEDWKIVTKIPEMPADCLDIKDWVNNQINSSLQRLGVKRLKALLLHRPKQLLESNGQELWAAIQKLQNTGKIEKCGFSIYEPEELELLWKDYQPDIIQSPFNIIDQRLKTSGWLEKLHNNGVEVHVRSIFLQGLLLMKKDDRPKRFNCWNSFWEVWDEWLDKEKLTPLEACIGFTNSEPHIDSTVVGVDNLQQLEQIITVSNKVITQPPKELMMTDENLINPSNWKKL
jgi:aryl-alcohol dehydrogenase-like predicted oxidoreductase